MTSENKERQFGLNSFVLKIIASLLMTLDHIAFLFIDIGSGQIPTDYYILRAIGKMAFPIFAFLAVEGIYHTKDAKKYLLRLGLCAIGMDLVSLIIGFLSGRTTIAANALLGNAFTDMFLGVLMIYFLKKKNWWSLLAILPATYGFFTTFPINDSWGTLFKADWGFFSIVLFLFLFLFREGADLYLKGKAVKDGMTAETYLINDGLKAHNGAEAIALVLTELLFYVIYRIDNFSFLLPTGFIPIGTYSTLAFVFYLFYNGKKGYQSPWIQYTFYAYYPVHLFLLGILSIFFGVLKTVV